MSVYDQAAVDVLAKLAFAADGAFLGLALAFVAVRSIIKFASSSSALRKIEQAPSVRVSDLRSLLDSLQDDGKSTETDGSSSQSDAGKLVIVRGVVEAKSFVDGHLKSLRSPNVLVSQETGDKGVILQRTQTCIYKEWRGLFGWTSRSMFSRSWKKQETSSIRMVPFVLVDAGSWTRLESVVVKMEGSQHHLPLTTVFHHLQPISPPPYTFLYALIGHEYPVGLLDEEKILPIGKEINVVGICKLRNATLEISSCKDLPYFLSGMTKDQMLVDLAFKTKVLLWGGVLIGSVAVGILGYAAVRNWNRLKKWRQERQSQNQSSSSSNHQNAPEEEIEECPDGELCVICLMRRRQSAFIPCGHLVCCQSCALSVELVSSPKCPVCRQSIRGSVRIYDS